MTAAAVATLRGQDHDLTWEIARRGAHPGLAGLVSDVCGYVERSATPVVRRQAPVAIVPLILSLGPSIEVDGRPHTSFVGGLHDRPVRTRFTGEQRGVQVYLTPLGAYRLLGVPPGELANQVAGLPLVDSLAERLADLPDWGTRFDVLEEVLLRRAADGPAPDPAVAWAWETLRRSAGTVPVGSLAAEIGWSRRHFATRFRTQIGLAPKAVARVLRFQRAAALLSRAEPAAAVASRCGYADQSHLVREFRALAGCTPGAYLGDRDSGQVAFVQDGPADPI